MLGAPPAFALLWLWASDVWPGSGDAVWAATLAAGLAAVATAPWRTGVKLAAALAYAPAATLALILFSLSAVCSAGSECL